MAVRKTQENTMSFSKTGGHSVLSNPEKGSLVQLAGKKQFYMLPEVLHTLSSLINSFQCVFGVCDTKKTTDFEFIVKQNGFY